MFRVFKVELIKLWSNRVTWGYLLFFILIVGYLSFTVTHTITPNMINRMPDGNPWYILLRGRFLNILTIVLISGLLTVVHFQSEHRNGMLQKVLVMPIKPFTFLLVKIFALLISMFFFQFLYLSITAIGTYYTGMNYYMSNEVQFANYNYTHTFSLQLLLSFQLFLCLWGYLAIISLLNIYIRNPVLSAAIVVLFWFVNFSRYSKVIPSGFLVQSDRLMSRHFSSTFSYDFSIFKYEWYSLITFLFVLITAYFLDKKGLLIKM